MKLGEKIKILRKKKGYSSRPKFHKAIQETHGKNAITLMTLRRIENENTQPSEKSLFQIALALNMSVSELKEGTETPPAKFVRYTTSKEKIVYNSTAYAEVLVSKQLNKLILKAKGKTKVLVNNTGDKVRKSVYLLKGRMIFCINKQKIILNNRGDFVIYNSWLPHHFENPSKKETSCLIVSLSAGS